MGAFAGAVLAAGVFVLLVPNGIGLALIGVPVVLSAVLGRVLVTALLAVLAAAVVALVLALQPEAYSDWQSRGAPELLIAAVAGVVLALCVYRWRRRVEAEEDRYRILAENATDLIFSTDPSGIITWASPSVQQILGWRPDELVGRRHRDLVHADDQATVEASDARVVEGRVEPVQVRLLDRQGGPHWVNAVVRPVVNEGHEVSSYVIAVRDIHSEVVAREELEREKDFDSLTGLARRALGLTRIEDILQTLGLDSWALLCVGVDGLSDVNHAYTYRAGDEVLRAVAVRLVAGAGAHDRVARVTGDEFVVMKRDITTAAEAAAAADRLIAAVRGPARIGDASVDVSVSVGIAFAGASTSDELLSDATAAMRAASAKGTGQWEFSDRTDAERAREALELRNDLRRAISGGEVRPWLMPIVELRTGAVVGYEALARWVHPDGSVTLPGAFLEVAERSGQMTDLDREILSQLLAVISRGPHGLQYGFNVSTASLTSEAFASWVLAEIHRAGVDPRCLHFEVTETTLFRTTTSVRDTVARIADLGVSWWVDDFGTGFSSISHLRDLPISGLKLDRSFTASLSLAENTYENRLANGLNGLAEGLGLDTVAEGVETAEQAQVLLNQGWRFGQGWLFGQAAPPPY